MARARIRPLAGRFPPAMIEDAVLLANELVTNAVLHGPGGRPVHLRILGADRLRIEVADAGDWRPPEVRMPEPGAGVEGGWGLSIVDELADGWGVTPSEAGTVAWAELKGA
jgi:serine/threonine-protein kinase RsbW